MTGGCTSETNTCTGADTAVCTNTTAVVGTCPAAAVSTTDTTLISFEFDHTTKMLKENTLRLSFTVKNPTLYPSTSAGSVTGDITIWIYSRVKFVWFHYETGTVSAKLKVSQITITKKAHTFFWGLPVIDGATKDCHVGLY